MQYRQTAWTAAYFATLSDFQKATKSVVPDDWKFVQQLAGGFAAGMFGAVFNTPGDVIRSTQQKALLAAPPERHPFSVGLCVTGVKDFLSQGGKIVSTNGVGALYMGFGFKALHLGGSGALLAMLIPYFKGMMGINGN